MKEKISKDVDLKKEFPLREGLIYLNHAMASPWPRRTAEALKAFADENLRQGATRFAEWGHTDGELRSRLRRLLNADAVEDIALVKNTSEGLSAVALGIDWEPGRNVVLPMQEFPSNRYCWDRLSAQGVEIRKVDILAAECPEQALIDACDDQTRLLTVSSVHFGTGLRMDLETLGRFCRDKGILFCVDAIQSLGALPVDVQAIQADFVVAGSQKWLLSPEGVAVFWSRAEARAQLRPLIYGWRSAQEPFDYDTQDWRLETSGRGFEGGTLNTAGNHALNASLSLFEEVGMRQVTDAVLERTDYLIERLSQRNEVQWISNLDAERRSGITVFRLQGKDNDTLHKHLGNHGVFCAKRGGGIRFSPHFYTPMEQLEEAVRWVLEY